MTVTDGAGPQRTMPPHPSAAQPPAARELSTPPLVSMPQTRRRPALLALGACLMAVGVLTGALLLNNAGNRRSVLAVARPVPFGSAITAADLSRAQLSLDPSVASVPWSELDQVVGRLAATDLEPGSLLTREQLTDASPPGPGQVLVPLAVPASRMPAISLQPGDKLLVVNTPAAGADPPTLPPTTIAATVVRLGETDLNGVTVLDVTVATSDGPALAARSATGRIALILEPRGK